MSTTQPGLCGSPQEEPQLSSLPHQGSRLPFLVHPPPPSTGRDEPKCSGKQPVSIDPGRSELNGDHEQVFTKSTLFCLCDQLTLASTDEWRLYADAI